jgi:hypothetical protein
VVSAGKNPFSYLRFFRLAIFLPPESLRLC